VYKPSDFNDLHCSEGLDAVRDQILHPEKYVKGLQPMLIRTNSTTKKAIIPSDREVAEYLLKCYGDKITKKDGCLFKYMGTHWVELSKDDIAKVKQDLQYVANSLLDMKKIKSYYEYFEMLCPSVPRGIDLFQPNPYAANFKNGTLHLWKNGSKRYHVEFRKHESTDYLTSVLPFDYPYWTPGQPLPEAPEFDAMIDRLWATNKDKEQIRRFIYQLGGACLAPAFPIIAWFYGPTRSGKSTIVKLLVKMLTNGNTSNVQLTELGGRFATECMVGKIVNFDTDADIVKFINDSSAKKIVDRVAQRVQRKGRTDVSAFLPAVHLFAANGLPKTHDGHNKAYGHRMRVIKTESFAATSENEDNFEDRLIANELPGMLCRFLQGLYDLCDSGGAYSEPDSNKENIASMEVDSDSVSQFLEFLKDGSLNDLVNSWREGNRGEIKRVKKSDLGEKFVEFQKNHVLRENHIGTYTFYREMEKRGFKKGIYEGVHTFEGLEIKVPKDAIS